MIDNDELDAWLYDVETTAQKVKSKFDNFFQFNIGQRYSLRENRRKKIRRRRAHKKREKRKSRGS